MISRLVLLGLLVVAVASFSSAQTPAMPLLQRPIPLEAALAKARELGLPTDKVEFAADEVFAVNDEVSFVANVTEGEKSRQWILLLRAQHVTEDEHRRYPVPEQVIYTNLAQAPVVFPAESIGGVAIRTLGPFRPNAGTKGQKDMWSGALVGPRFLRLGLIGPSLTIGAMQTKQLHGMVSFNQVPLPEKQVQEGIALREQLGLTDDDLRGFAAFSPAMLNFFAIANQTEGVNTIVREMIDLPWLSLALNGGRLKDINFNLTDPFIDLPADYWSLPSGTRVRTIGVILHLNGKPALRMVFAVTPPKPPLYNCAGIVGLVAERPDGTGPRLTVCLLGARPAAERTPTGVRTGSR